MLLRITHHGDLRYNLRSHVHRAWTWISWQPSIDGIAGHGGSHRLTVDRLRRPNPTLSWLVKTIPARTLYKASPMNRLLFERYPGETSLGAMKQVTIHDVSPYL